MQSQYQCEGKSWTILNHIDWKVWFQLSINKNHNRKNRNTWRYFDSAIYLMCLTSTASFTITSVKGLLTRGDWHVCGAKKQKNAYASDVPVLFSVAFNHPNAVVPIVITSILDPGNSIRGIVSDTALIDSATSRSTVPQFWSFQVKKLTKGIHRG